MKARVSAWLLGGLFFSILCVYGQVTTGTISGTVSDSSGGAIPAAEVVILNEDTGISRTLQTDAAGRYLAPSLNPGRYRVTAGVQGFQTEVRSGIQLTVGREAVVNFELPVGSVTERVEVTGEAPLVQTTEATISYLVDDRTIRELPLNGRDISQLILLNPGVTQNRSGKWGKPEWGFAQRISISGMRGEDNSYLLDGTYINTYKRHLPAGPTGALLGIETVREFQMLTATFSAQYGRALGGVINAVTKSGTNEWHGSGYEFLRNSALDARNFFDRQDNPSDPRLPPFRRNHFGATVGGPIVRDKTFFFVAYEGLRQSLAETVIANVPDLNARQGILPGRTVPVSPLIVPFLRMFPAPTPSGRNFGDGTAQLIFQAKQPTREDFGQARVDYQFSANDSFFGRFTGNNMENAAQLNYPDRFAVGLMETRLATLSETHVFSPRLLNSVRFAFNRAIPGQAFLVPPAEPGQISVPGQPYPAQIEAGSGITPLTGTEDPGSRYLTNRFGFNDDVNLMWRNHSLQFGGMLERLRFNPNIGHHPMGQWRFSNLASFLQAIPNRYTGTPPQIANFRRGVRQWFLALYLQDDWRVTPNLTLNLGLRWEPYTVPTEVNGLIENQRHLMDPALTRGDPYWLNKSWRNFSPRSGFAWSPSPSGKTSLRGGFGLFYVPVDSALYMIPLLRGGTISPQLEIANPLHFPNALETIAVAEFAPGSQQVYGMPFDNLRSSYALQYSLSVQQQIGASNVLTLGYNGRRGIVLPSLGNFNMPLFRFNGLSLEMPANATQNNPAFNAIRYIGTNSNSWYNGFTAALQRKFSAGLQGQISYTFARAISEADGADTGNSVSAGGSGSVKYPHDLRVGKGLSGYHLKNVLTANYSYDLPWGRGASGWAGRVLSGWQLTGIVSLQDGQPSYVVTDEPSALAPYMRRSSPNLVPGWTHDQIVRGSPDGYFSLDAFTPPGPRELGNLGRNTLMAPGLAQWDFGLTKNTQLGERFRLQFRTEIFNMLNRANFSSPGQVGTEGAGGSIFTRAGAPIQSATVIGQTATTSRQIQLGLKLIF